MPVLPLVGVAVGLMALAFGAFLGGDRLGHRLSQLNQVGLHVLNGLLQNLLWIFGLIHPVVELSPHHSSHAIE
jgi:hypothetical protein